MSYCRFSTDAFRCQVYAYEDMSGGWTIHVAGRKRQIPDDAVCPMELLGKVGDSEWLERYQQFHKMLDACEWTSLTTESAGKTFSEPTLEAFRARMTALRAEGISFPDYVLRSIDEEIAEYRETAR